MSSAAQLDASPEVQAWTVDSGKVHPLSSVTASGQRLTKKELKRAGHSKAEEWQNDAWDMYDLVGEQRFISNTLANRMSQARFFVGKLPKNPTEDVEPVTEGPAYEAFQSMLGKGQHFKQIVQRLGLNLFMPGDGYLVGTPKQGHEERPDNDGGISPTLGMRAEENETTDVLSVDLNTLEWRMLGLSEVAVNSDTGEVELKGPKKEGDKTKWDADEIFLLRVWRPHPQKWWQADSPTRSTLPVLRELVGLTMHISAQIDSRLAGAGVFLIPQSADAAMRAAAGKTGENDYSPFAEELLDAAMTAIEDRSAASALVPLMPVVPDESIEKFKFISFASPLDKESIKLREEAIRRVALGEDCPPELLLGVASMNHWGAWLVREDVVTTHLEPPLALICDAITTQFLWPVLEQQNVADFEDFVIWYDVDHLISRANRSADAKTAKELGVINDAATRDALGFDEGDAPEVVVNDPVKDLVLEMLRSAPSLAQNPGLPMLAEQIRAMLAGQVIPAAGAEAAPAAEEQPAEEEPAEEGGVPATQDEDAVPEGLAASAARATPKWCGDHRPHKRHPMNDTDTCGGVDIVH